MTDTGILCETLTGHRGNLKIPDQLTLYSKQMNKQQNLCTTVSKLIAQAWLDNSFYHRLINEPAAVLREAGLILDDFAQVQVNQNAPAFPTLTAEAGGALTINIPHKPAGLADELINCLAIDSAVAKCSC